MKKLALLLCLISSFALADDMPNNIHQASSPIANAHYEIVVSSWMRKLTFRLDRYNGRVWIKVVDPKEDKLWEAMYVENLPWAANSTHAHFQMFLSGVFVADSYLVDTDSGKVWMIVKADKKPDDAENMEHLSWQAIGEENQSEAPKPLLAPHKK